MENIFLEKLECLDPAENYLKIKEEPEEDPLSTGSTKNYYVTYQSLSYTVPTYILYIPKTINLSSFLAPEKKNKKERGGLP